MTAVDCPDWQTLSASLVRQTDSGNVVREQLLKVYLLLVLFLCLLFGGVGRLSSMVCKRVFQFACKHDFFNKLNMRCAATGTAAPTILSSPIVAADLSFRRARDLQTPRKVNAFVKGSKTVARVHSYIVCWHSCQKDYLVIRLRP